MRLVFLAPLASLVTLAACSGSTHGNVVPIAVSPSPSGTRSANATAAVTFTFSVPARATATRRGRRYVSPSTVSAAIAVAPHGAQPGPAVTLACTSGATCSTQVVAPIGDDDFAVVLSDGSGGSGNALSRGSIEKTIVFDTANVVTLDLDGVVASVELSLDKPTLPAGTAASDVLHVNAFDADHNLIVAPGGYVDVAGNPVTISVAESDDGGCGTPGIGKTTLDRTTFTGTSADTANVAYDGNEVVKTAYVPVVSRPIANPGTLLSTSLTFVPTFDKYVTLTDTSDDIAAGPDGALWATEPYKAKIARIDAKTAALTEYSSKLAAESSAPEGIVTGPDGQLWFTDGDAPGAIGTMSTAGTVTNKYLLTPLTSNPIDSKDPLEIVVGPDANLYFTEKANDAIGRITPGTNAMTSIVEYTIPSGTDTEPRGITIGPDKNVWFTESTGKNVGYLTPATTAIKEFPFPPSADGSEYAYDISPGSDGKLRFSQTDNHIERIAPDGSGLTSFTLTYDDTTSIAPARRIVNGPDCTRYFSVFSNAGYIGKIDASGATTLYPLPAYPGADDNMRYPEGITIGPDGHVWFTEDNHPIVARLAI